MNTECDGILEYKLPYKWKTKGAVVTVLKNACR